MGFSPERRAQLVDMLGEKKVKELEEETKRKSDRITNLGIEFKSLDATDFADLERLSSSTDDNWISDVFGLK